jgi:hypothetical protein
MGYKDPASNLWTLPIFQGEEGLWTTPRSDSVVSESTLSQPSPCKGRAPPPPFVPPPEFALFLYYQTTKANAVKFIHQSLCNPPITSLIKAINAASSAAPHTSMPSPSKNILCQALQHQKATLNGHAKACEARHPTRPVPFFHAHPVPQASINLSCRA